MTKAQAKALVRKSKTRISVSVSGAHDVMYLEINKKQAIALIENAEIGFSLSEYDGCLYFDSAQSSASGAITN